MSEIESYLDHVCRGVAGSRSLRQHIREELREHLTEAVERHAAGGLPENEAARRAIEEFGQAEMVSEGLQDIYGRRLVALLVEKAMEWKERTMKSDWKWSFVGNLALLSRRKNSDAGNLDFDRKKEEYFSKNGVTPFAITTQILAEKVWTPEVVERRQKALFKVACEIWKV